MGTRSLHGAPCPCALISQRPWSCGRAAPRHPRPPSPLLKCPPHHGPVPRGPPRPRPVPRGPPGPHSAPRGPPHHGPVPRDPPRPRPVPRDPPGPHPAPRGPPRPHPVPRGPPVTWEAGRAAEPAALGQLLAAETCAVPILPTPRAPGQAWDAKIGRCSGRCGHCAGLRWVRAESVKTPVLPGLGAAPPPAAVHSLPGVKPPREAWPRPC